MLKIFFRVVIFTGFIVGFFCIACSKKSSSNSRNGEEESQSTMTTTSGGGLGSTGGSSTTGNIPTGTPVSGSPSCTLISNRLVCNTFFPNVFFTSGSFYQNWEFIHMYNYNGPYYLTLYFRSVGLPASGGYTVVPGTNPGNWEVGIEVIKTGGVTIPKGTGQSGVVYVVNNGATASATFCNVPLTIVSGTTTSSATASGKISN
jgi:hypothetical protein